MRPDRIKTDPEGQHRPVKINPYDWLEDVTLSVRRLPDGEMGAWVPSANTILIDDRLSQVERRCTVMHELIHRLRQDVPDLPPPLADRQERECNRRTARLLIDLGELLDALLWSAEQHDSEIADSLWVDLPTLHDRLSSLTSAEREYLTERLAQMVERAA